MPKRRTPLQVQWEYAMVQSCANGTMRVTPVWRDGKPGVITRLYAARQLHKLIARELRVEVRVVKGRK